MPIVNMAYKFGPDDVLEREWTLPAAVRAPLRDLVAITPDGWIMDEWDVTPQIAAVIQPYLDEPIVLDSPVASWQIGSCQEA